MRRKVWGRAVFIWKGQKNFSAFHQLPLIILGFHLLLVVCYLQGKPYIFLERFSFLYQSCMSEVFYLTIFFSNNRISTQKFHSTSSFFPSFWNGKHAYARIFIYTWRVVTILRVRLDIECEGAREDEFVYREARQTKTLCWKKKLCKELKERRKVRQKSDNWH